MSVVDIDREERRSARRAAERAGEWEGTHLTSCHCRECLVDDFDPRDA